MMLFYQLLKDRVRIAPISPGVRDYSNVTLHVARTAAGLGKSVADDTKHLRLPVSQIVSRKRLYLGAQCSYVSTSIPRRSQKPSALMR